MKKYTKPEFTIASFEASDSIAIEATVSALPRASFGKIDFGNGSGTINFS